ncbi:MAG: hypothetical protein ACE5GY_06330 [Thermodesulfobacteriota bacterium]
MDTYIVRIYRREGNGTAGLAGVVEEAGAEGVRVFHTMEELSEIIMRRSGGAGHGRRPVRPKRKLKVLVKGANALSKSFTEEAAIENLTPGGGRLLLKNRVVLNARLRLVIDPEHSALEVGCCVVGVGKARGLHGVEVSFDRRI